MLLLIILYNLNFIGKDDLPHSIITLDNIYKNLNTDEIIGLTYLRGDNFKEEYKYLFMSKYNLTYKDMELLWSAFINYGMNNSSKNCSHSTKSHYYFQGICEHYELLWDDYGSKMPQDAKKWMKDNYPSLIGVNDTHSYNF